MIKLRLIVGFMAISAIGSIATAANASCITVAREYANQVGQQGTPEWQAAYAAAYGVCDSGDDENYVPPSGVGSPFDWVDTYCSSHPGGCQTNW